MSRELQIKVERIREYLRKENADALLLGNNENFCWLSCGHSAFVDKGSSNAVAKLLVTMDGLYVFTNSSEQFRIPEEELAGLGFELVAYPWHGSEGQTIRPYLEGKVCFSDNGAFGTENRSGDVTTLRYVLTDEEIARFREIGPLCANIMENCCREIEVGQNEYQIAGNVTGKLMAEGFQVPVCLIAADDRLMKYRHPLPTGAVVNKRVLVAICAQKYGLTISMSRVVNFGELDELTKKKQDAIARIDATYILSTVVGEKAGNVVKKGHAAYAAEGFEADFHLHHQGGALGYLTRDYCANEQNESVILDRQGFSWNPTVAGMKSEDTYLVLGDKIEILSQTETWPSVEVTVDGKTIRRPLVLIK